MGSSQLKTKKVFEIIFFYFYFLSRCNESDLRRPSIRSHSNRRQRPEEVYWGLSFDLSPFQIKSRLKVSGYSQKTVLHSSTHSVFWPNNTTHELSHLFKSERKKSSIKKCFRNMKYSLSGDMEHH